MAKTNEFVDMLEAIAEAASSAAVAEEEGNKQDIDYWEAETKRRIQAALKEYESAKNGIL